MFFQIIEEQVKNYEEQFARLRYIGDDIIEFASYPIYDKSYKIDNSQREKLINIIKN